MRCRSTTRRPSRLLSAGLIVALFYQLGACPCGCPEHNAWLELLGLFDHDHYDLPSSDEEMLVGPYDHDCEGKPRDKFVRTLRPTNKGDGEFHSAPFLTDRQDVDAASRQVVCCLVRGPPHPLRMTPSRTMLQVFLL